MLTFVSLPINSLNAYTAMAFKMTRLTFLYIIRLTIPKRAIFILNDFIAQTPFHQLAFTIKWGFIQNNG